MRRVWILVVAGLLVAACGDDSGGEVSVEGGPEVSDEFCATLEPLATIDPVAEPTGEELALLEDARAAVPDDLKPAFDELIAVTEVFVDPEIDLEDLESDEETQRAAAADLTASAEACGLEVPIFDYDGGGASVAPSGRDRYESSDLRAAIEVSDPTLEGRVDTIARVNDEITVQIAELTDPDQALAVCAVVDGYLVEIDYPQASARVADTSDTGLATRASGGGCTAAG